ncbi:MAG: RNA-guided endonuclease TnpB family protein [Rubripirellula sp.]
MAKKKAAETAEVKKLPKVAKYEILKPEGWVGGDKDGEPCTWSELAKLLRDVQYLSSRICNKLISDLYVASQQKRHTKFGLSFTARKVSEINKQLREELIASGDFSEKQLNQFSKTGCLSSYVTDAMAQSLVGPQTSGQNWSEVLKGNAAVPSYKRNVPVCVRCDKAESKKVFLDDDGDHKLDLALTVGSKVRVVLRTGKLDGSQKTILDRLTTKDSGWTQQTFQISYNERRKKWFLSVTYRFPPQDKKLNPDVIVGADLGYSCPLFAAVSNSKHARIGRLEFQGISAQVKSLQSQTMRRRREIQRSGKDSFAGESNRSGHGRKRRLKPTERFEDKINNAYKTLNHQISRRLIDFAMQHRAGTIQLEDLSGMQDALAGSFLGERWRYHELQEFIKYKAKEVGIIVKLVDPQYTSRRCYKCGDINEAFTREYRDKNKPAGGGVCQYFCNDKKCGAKDIDPDFNAAKNLATKDIAQEIKKQCKKQGIVMKVKQTKKKAAKKKAAKK